jgi:hypothetical protein
MLGYLSFKVFINAGYKSDLKDFGFGDAGIALNHGRSFLSLLWDGFHICGDLCMFFLFMTSRV